MATLEDNNGMIDLTDIVNVTDDITNETLFGIDRTLYYDLDKLEELSSSWNFKNNLTVLSLNIRSLTNKISHLSNILSHLDAPPTIICLQEIWGTHGNLNLEGYNKLEYYSRDSIGIPNPNCGGGVGIYIRSGINFQKISLVNIL